MATIVNNPAPNNSNSGMGFLIGVIVLIVFGVLFFIYGLPYLQQLTSSGVQVNVPKDINVNIQQEK